MNTLVRRNQLTQAEALYPLLFTALNISLKSPFLSQLIFLHSNYHALVQEEKMHFYHIWRGIVQALHAGRFHQTSRLADVPCLWFHVRLHRHEFATDSYVYYLGSQLFSLVEEHVRRLLSDVWLNKGSAMLLLPTCVSESNLLKQIDDISQHVAWISEWIHVFEHYTNHQLERETELYREHLVLINYRYPLLRVIALWSIGCVVYNRLEHPSMTSDLISASLQDQPRQMVIDRWFTALELIQRYALVEKHQDNDASAILCLFHSLSAGICVCRAEYAQGAMRDEIHLAASLYQRAVCSHGWKETPHAVRVHLEAFKRLTDLKMPCLLMQDDDIDASNPLPCALLHLFQNGKHRKEWSTHAISELEKK